MDLEGRAELPEEDLVPAEPTNFPPQADFIDDDLETSPYHADFPLPEPAAAAYAGTYATGTHAAGTDSHAAERQAHASFHAIPPDSQRARSEEHTSELQSQ